MSEDDGLKAMGQVIQIDEARLRDHLGEMVRGTVEETLNALLDAEADRLCGAGRYERNQGRQDTRACSYERSLHTVAGEVNLKVPKRRAEWQKYQGQIDPERLVFIDETHGHLAGLGAVRHHVHSQGPARDIFSCIMMCERLWTLSILVLNRPPVRHD